MRLLYGGSLKPGNAAEILSLANVNGGLIGGASLKAAKAAALTTQYGLSAVLGVLALVYAAMAAFWFFAARRQSVVAKWLISIWFVVAACTTALSLFRGGFGFDLGSVLGLLTFLLLGWSVSYLFKPDADAWFKPVPPSAG